jgi:hypothetical protein
MKKRAPISKVDYPPLPSHWHWSGFSVGPVESYVTQCTCLLPGGLHAVVVRHNKLLPWQFRVEASNERGEFVELDAAIGACETALRNAAREALKALGG